MTAPRAITPAVRTCRALARHVRRVAVLALFAAAVYVQAAVPLLDTYYSPKNKERPVRSSTRFIVLHTTEGSLRGSGAKLQKNGEANYMVDSAGRIYRIIDRKRVAYHCGRSMWNGLSSLDNYSIGIEVVGFHDKNPTAAQCAALKSLLDELKKTYGIPDSKVLTHSMVAYGAPNQWHRRSHRGRKRCAMRMALPSVRKKLGLASKPAFDPDVRAGRLVVADKELQQLLYSVEKSSASSKGRGTKAQAQKKPAAQPSPAAQKPVQRKPAAAQSKPAQAKPAAAPDANVVGRRRSPWDIAKAAYNSSTTLYEFPDGTSMNGAEITNWKAIPPGTKVTVGAAAEAVVEAADHRAAAPETAAAEAAAPRAAAPEAAPPADADAPVSEEEATARYAAKEAVSGGNVIGPKRSAWDIARDAYNSSTTIYEFPNGTTKTGAEISNWKAIPAGTVVTIAPGESNEPETVSSLGDAGFTAPASATAGSSPDSAPSAETPSASATPAAEVRAVPDPLSALTAIAGAEWNSRRTVYVQPDGTYFLGDELDAAKLAALSPDTKVFSGYKVGGPVTAKNPAFAICGPSWRDEGTHFLLPGGAIVTGDKIDATKIPPNTMVLYKD